MAAPARLARAFYERDTLDVARDLVGKVLVHGGRTARIVETEAYHGPEDRAAHSFRGRTPRTAIMFGRAGMAYVYQIYGMWFCLNAVTMPEGFPAAVLIRGAELLGDEEDPRAAAGPGKLCRALAIDKRQNGADLVDSEVLWIGDDGVSPGPREIARATRIGVDYAGTWAKKPWRFLWKGHPSVSKPARAKRRKTK